MRDTKTLAKGKVRGWYRSRYAHRFGLNGYFYFDWRRPGTTYRWWRTFWRGTK